MEFLKCTIHHAGIIIVMLLVVRSASELEDDDVLQPYKGHHGPVHRRLRDTQECQRNRYGNTTYSLYAAHVNQSDLSHVVDFHHKLDEVVDLYMKRTVGLRFQRVYNPLRTLSVLEPGHPGSCEETPWIRATVEDTARKGNCVFAANAGFFNTHSGECLGNIVSNGRIVRDSEGIQNAHFGITREGQIFTGYLSEIELVTLQFKQLVGGVVWLLRDGEVHVDMSRDIECPDTEETGTLDRFITVLSARTAVGHDADGHVLMVQVDGKTGQRGLDMYEFADILKKLGFVNAINMDGGGSATSVVNGTIVNYPSDSCRNTSWNCARAVSTILCVHEAECEPDPSCSGHGQCLSGVCQCRPPWTGPSCRVLACPNGCSGHGRCLEGGCECDAGWSGEDCLERCQEGRFGANCSRLCDCQNGASCHPDSGLCVCTPGFTGTRCEDKCSYGRYGDKCQSQCNCKDQCFCHHITGTCSNTTEDASYWNVSRCLMTAAIKKDKLVPDQTRDLLMWKWVAAAGGVVAIISVAINVMLALALLCSKKSKPSRRRRPKKHYSYKSRKPESGDLDSVELVPLRVEGGYDSSQGETSEESEEVDDFQK